MLDDSDIASNQLLRQTIYPDSTDDADRVTHAYNRQGEITQTTDQNGTVHEFLRDLLGRPTDDQVTTLGTGIDGAVRRISRTYEVRGLPYQVTSYDAATSGSVVNQIQYVYNDFGQATKEYQEHGGAVNTGTTLFVGYSYEDGSDNTVRPTGITYPNGRELTYAYASDDDDALSRITSIDDAGPSTRVGYTYLGLAMFVRADYPEPQIRWDLIAGGLDWGYDLSGVAGNFALQERGDGQGIVYSSHIYPWKKDWQGKVLAAAEKYPIFVGEVGCPPDWKGFEFIPPSARQDLPSWPPDMLGLIQKHQLNWTGFSFHPKCGPMVILDWQYTPTPYWGVYVKEALSGKAFELKSMR